MELPTSAKVNVTEVIAHSRFGAVQWGLCILCGVCLFMDGFDVQAIGYVAPVTLKEWQVGNAQFGPSSSRGGDRSERALLPEFLALTVSPSSTDECHDREQMRQKRT
jgi:hypothetical protein